MPQHSHVDTKSYILINSWRYASFRSRTTYILLISQPISLAPSHLRTTKIMENCALCHCVIRDCYQHGLCVRANALMSAPPTFLELTSERQSLQSRRSVGIWELPGRYVLYVLQQLFGPQTLIIDQAMAVFCDWILALLPIAFLRDIQMSVKTKASICILMGIGILFVSTPPKPLRPHLTSNIQFWRHPSRPPHYFQP